MLITNMTKINSRIIEQVEKQKLALKFLSRQTLSHNYYQSLAQAYQIKVQLIRQNGYRKRLHSFSVVLSWKE